MKPIVVVGSINMDLVSSVERMPAVGETLLGKHFQMHPGGKGANQAVAVARLEHPSILLGAIGDDVFGTQLHDALKAAGVDTQHLLTADGASGIANIFVDAHGGNVIVVTPGANAHVTPRYLQSKMEILRSAGMVLAQLEIPLPTISWLADRCAELNVPLMLDPAPAAPLPPSLLRQVAWFTPNESEAAFYAGQALPPGEMAELLLQSGIRNLLLKRGAGGVLFGSANGDRLSVDAFRVDAVDTTAAGDAFNGAVAVALVRNAPVVEALRYASAAAAISVTRAGAQPSLANAAEVENWFSKSTS